MLIDWFTVGAQALNFVVLVWLMKRFLYKPILQAIDAVAERLGNTRTVCRKYYVHPALLHAYMQGLTAAQPNGATPRRKRRIAPPPALRRDEVTILQFLNDVL